MRLLLVFLLLSYGMADAQSFSIKKVATYVNDVSSDPVGRPGNFISTRITYSNSSSSTIHVFMNRTKNQLPKYWALCYCYIQCHSPIDDTVTVEVLPNSTTDITIQYKTDSILPGTASASFNIYQVGFPAKTETLQMTGTTSDVLGIHDWKTSKDVVLYPNPATNEINLNSGTEKIISVQVIDLNGRMISEQSYLDEQTYRIKTANLDPGMYFIEARCASGTFRKHIIKQ